MKTVCRFTVLGEMTRADLEALLVWAIFSAECAIGPVGVRLGAAFWVEEDPPRCIVDVSAPAGEHVARVFAGLLTRRLGETGFRVERFEDVRAGAGAVQ